jgi:hypothetical protein
LARIQYEIENFFDVEIQSFDFELDKVYSLINKILDALNDPYHQNIKDNDKMIPNHVLGVLSSYILRQNAKTDAILILDVKNFIVKTIDYIDNLENLKLNKKKLKYWTFPLFCKFTSKRP